MQTYKHWITDNQKAVNTLLEEELDFWLNQVDTTDIPAQTPIAAATRGNYTIKVPVSASLSGVQIQNRAITALLHALYDITANDTAVIFREGHGRNSLGSYDVSDAIGWFTCKFPTRYRVIPGKLHESLELITNANKQVPNGGVGYDVLRYYGPLYINRQLECKQDILFNYLGDLSFTGSQQEEGLFQAVHTGFSSTVQRGSIEGLLPLFKLNVNGWKENNIFVCVLDIAATLGLNKHQYDQFTTAVQNYLQVLMDPVVKGLVTPFQRGLISYAFNNPDSQSYINQISFVSTTPIPFNFFQEVCRLLTTKYEILRTSYHFDYQTGQFYSTVLPDGTLNCDEYFDGSEELLSKIKAKGFRIDQEPLIRFSLINEKIIVISSHHIIIDGTSVNYLLKELLTIASHLQQGLPVETSIPHALKFSTYAAWIARKDEQAAVAYWQQLLQGATPCLLEDKTPGDSTIPENTFADAGHRISVPSAVISTLKQHHLTTAAALNFLTGAVLSRLMGRDQVIWGNTVTIRPFELDAVETIVGPCIATIPVTLNTRQEITTLAAIKGLQEQLMESQEHGFITLNDINRAAGKQQLFSVTYVFQNYLQAAMDQERSNTFQSLAPADNNISSHFPVNILVHDGGQEIGISVKYRKDYFSERLINDFCSSLGFLLQQLPALLSTAVKDIDLFGHLQPSVLKGQKVPIQPLALHEAFMVATAKDPAKIALIDTEEQLSYQELDAMSNQIYAMLSHKQISGAVGIRMKRSVKMIAVIIGVLKSGGHVVSLEKDFPDEKVRWIHENVHLSAAFTDADTQLDLDCPIFRLDTIQPLHERPQLPFVSPTALCCINYTSGSTGVPKLVEISHAGHANRIAWLSDQYAAESDDVYGFKTMLCFGPSLREVFEPLVQGSTLFVYSNESNNNPALFHQETVGYKVTRLFLTPTFIRLLHDFELQSALKGMKYLEISGEPIGIPLYDSLRQQFPHTRIVGRYGATEAPGTVYYTKGITNNTRNLQLGSPIWNTDVKVLNEAGDLLPTGIIGEIALSGEAISTGYINKDQEVGNFILINGVKHVKTGDVGFIDQEGILQFQSRKTRMVKIRGFRVEPAEIEVNLTRHPGIKKAVVVPVVSKVNTRLTAFYIKNEGAEVQQLRSWLEKLLPPYMIPHDFREINRLPLTDSGKVDFVTLTKMATAHEGTGIQTTLTGLEQQIHDVISELIGHADFDTYANFLEIGMDSILSMKAVYKIRKITDTDIVVNDLYMHPNIKELSAFIENREDQPYFIINQRENNGHLFFIPPIGSNQIDVKALQEAVPGNITLVIFKPVNPDDIADLSIETIAAHYIRHMQEIAPQGPVHISGWSLGATICFEAAIQLQQAGVSTGNVLLFDPGLYNPAYDETLTKERLEEILKKLGDVAIRESVLTAMLNANQLITKYKPAVYSGDVYLFKPSDISVEERNYNKEWNGLEDYVTGKIIPVKIPGNHMNMLADIQRNRQFLQELL